MQQLQYRYLHHLHVNELYDEGELLICPIEHQLSAAIRFAMQDHIILMIMTPYF